MWDAEIYCIDRGKKAKVSTMSIIEELGQIDFIFSDKTGTLTRNIMEFKLMNIGGIIYGDQSALEIRPRDYHDIERKVSRVDVKEGIDFAFEDKDLNALLQGNTAKGEGNKLKVYSSNGKECVNLRD